MSKTPEKSSKSFKPKENFVSKKVATQRKVKILSSMEVKKVTYLATLV
jgi:hypothetical protein